MKKVNDKKTSKAGCSSKRDAAHACNKYELAITNYVLGEQMDISYDELFNHLRECKKCREDLYDWQNTYAAMRTKEYFSRPETKKKMADMIENVKKEVLGPSILTTLPPARDTDWEIGLAAREIYNCLKANGPIPIPVIRVKTGLTDYPFRESVGWLAREGKITILGDPKTGYASLNPGR